MITYYCVAHVIRTQICRGSAKKLYSEGLCRFKANLFGNSLRDFLSFIEKLLKKCKDRCSLKFVRYFLENQNLIFVRLVKSIPKLSALKSVLYSGLKFIFNEIIEKFCSKIFFVKIFMLKRFVLKYLCKNILC